MYVDAPRGRGGHTNRVYLPGSFNPLHEGHKQMLAAAVALAAGDGAAAEGCFELTVRNADKVSVEEGPCNYTVGHNGGRRVLVRWEGGLGRGETEGSLAAEGVVAKGLEEQSAAGILDAASIRASVRVTHKGFAATAAAAAGYAGAVRHQEARVSVCCCWSASACHHSLPAGGQGTTAAPQHLCGERRRRRGGVVIVWRWFGGVTHTHTCACVCLGQKRDARGLERSVEAGYRALVGAWDFHTAAARIVRQAVALLSGVCTPGCWYTSSAGGVAFFSPAMCARACQTQPPSHPSFPPFLPPPPSQVGWDTAVRVVMPKYYGDSDTSMQLVLAEIKHLGCHFLVAGRVDDKTDGGFKTLSDIQLPPGTQGGLFKAIPEASFRSDVSSTALRAAGKGL